MHRSNEIKLGNLKLGGDNPVRIQSMTNTKTSNIKSTIDQIIDLVNGGCEIVRVTTQNIPDSKCIKEIKDELEKRNLMVPIVADVHFNPKVAEIAALYADKVRINPGNYYSSEVNETNLEAISRNLLPLINICKQHDTIIRIGVNHGSLSDRILQEYGDTPLGMVESLMEFVEVFSIHDFHNIVLSVKTSSVPIMIESNLLLVDRLKSKGVFYPIHLGVTEAGGDDEGRIKSALGIGYLLSKGIGDTIRVSLAESPIMELPIARYLACNYGISKSNNFIEKQCIEKIRIPVNEINGPIIISNKTSKYSDYTYESLKSEKIIDSKIIDIVKLDYSDLDYNTLMVRTSADLSSILYNKYIDGVSLSNTLTNDDQNAKILQVILQAMGKRIFNSEYIACPTCGRTNIELVNLLRKVKHHTDSLVGLKIAVMGCIVNGPGEMLGADYGLVGSSKGYLNLYKKGKIVSKRIPQDEAVKALTDLIKLSGDWND
ncbi:MAG: (E)-4-hydroxy-3-methylbut-2-enyl-diphosphate synthase [Lentimicrobiaceae bacterium]|jgi:(E)-4-hydroxy-3-methylbut-2-enyl-diphosphate synthase|nr:(E)-4-hydroxy-3-methylbut-2-enyl-diphosphate synthase [Lentimicrobiaceae bacterium]MBT3454079.1 (E)-4-hydroxy-3-methylbut-2-enyl-diphosphate synthase [Lentimicrobiaceae bacterium]MBT3819197.1 (E)-4-hydroxy-3-methylbut-2-enyl-diphosphate synthase [Lentimicrobiaceae bacterium]MBT4060626.1 (E)-4-hydroxy-3-methylbut-2-enyl-diphosphate synthase [Lentimicrobiaceae bacterium]MBT4189590.1 (E)-4-hydroxy-3-methylbut-2-enyl-diphosphate synthase [Lentimicrobiaceae bacterium]